MQPQRTQEKYIAPACHNKYTWTRLEGRQDLVEASKVPQKGATQLTNEGVAAVLLHCFGFSLAMREQAAHASGLPVISVRDLCAKALSELLE